MYEGCHHPGINRAQYKAMFGVDDKVGFASSSMPHEPIPKVNTEEHLFDLASMEVNTNTDIDSVHSTDDEAMDTSEVQPSVGTSNVCVVCQDIVFGEFKCLSCNKNVHVKCGKTNLISTEEFEVSQESNIICLLCYSESNIESERLSAKTSMEKQVSM